MMVATLEIPSDWPPTAENINALPDPLRRYIHQLQTRTDPAGDVRRIAELKDQVEALEIRLREARTTQRDEFAMSALQGIVIGRPFCDRAFAAKTAYEFADAMMEARKQ